MSKVDQKDYLKKYLSKNEPGKKKKKKKQQTIANRVRIIDDDADIQTFNEAVQEDFLLNEDAPQIAGIIDERPVELRMEDFCANTAWVNVSDNSKTKDSFSIMLNDNNSEDKDNSPPRRNNRDDDNSPLRKDDNSPPRKSRKDDNSPLRKTRNDANSPPRKSRSEDYSPSRKSRNEDNSPPRKSRNEDNSPPRKARKDDNSPLRKANKDNNNPPRNTRMDDNSPPRKFRSGDNSPHKKARKDYNSPPRKTKNYDNSPPRKARKDDNSPLRKTRNDNSPPRKTRNDDNSPPRKTRMDDNSPPRKNKNLDSSPPRKNRKDNSPPRRSKNDSSPPRKSHTNDNSPPRKNRHSSPPRKHKKNDNNRKSSSPLPYLQKENSPPVQSSSRKKRSRWGGEDYSEPPAISEKMSKTLDGKAAGLQNAKDLVTETLAFKKREDDTFKSMSADVSGVNATTIVRDRKTGKKRDFEQEEVANKEKSKKQNEVKEKYDKWGKGTKQVEDYNKKLEEDVYEMSKPLARYADDVDLEEHLKAQERAGDPMLAYLKKKKKKEAIVTGKPAKPQYEGEFMPNRFGIRPGHNWDGVDRSNGYETKWFEVINQKQAQKDEAYKWNSEDM